MNRSGKKCVLYPRVSTEMQVDGFSLDGQKNSLTRFADREEMEIIDIYEDAGKSGKSIEGRPAFKQMLNDIEYGLGIDYVLVYKLSRFGRNAADILNSLEHIQSFGVNLICIDEGIDSSQTSGKLLISVLSAVAEIERENIIEQTMNGRKEKARQGGWNGGFAPYGYYLKDKQLFIQEDEAEAVRIIFHKYVHGNMGFYKIANYLNLQGIQKVKRDNGTLTQWSTHFIRMIIDNPVYYGKIAFGRRTREKVKGTKNEYRQVHQDDYILADGQHDAIISEELWTQAHEKREITGVKSPSKIGRDRAHLLSGILKCPKCGGPMYTNKHAWTNKDGTYKEIYYYVCSKAVEQDSITLENIYTLLANFDKVYDKINDEEKKSLISSLIKEIEIFPCDESELPLKSILFNFPVYKDGGDVYEFLWDKSTHVSTCLEVTIKMS
ncbi:recombinase family protein [Tissierella carlieri]|uniref:Recombinase family protein n=1 Tax=Tissierella carlieri TaxID=689904 RepID=A0ABT1S6R2_9FIRM|nr:recombinase family protein [Tissierella carlieri]MCQ4922167.1 recombinase family protein [Tissierella carlieri]